MDVVARRLGTTLDLPPIESNWQCHSSEPSGRPKQVERLEGFLKPTFQSNCSPRPTSQSRGRCSVGQLCFCSSVDGYFGVIHWSNRS
jgi:hypothetical protein